MVKFGSGNAGISISSDRDLHTTMTESQSQSALVLIASGGEWVGRSLENVLESNGYTVLRVESGRRALEIARRTNPDAVLLDDSLPDIGAVDVSRALRDDPLFNHSTPIIITAAAQHASRVRASAYAAGAWDYCTLPVDVETLLAKLGTFVRARHEIETVRSKALFDRLTGLYTEYGLQHWVEQLGARALRKREAIACVVVAPDVAAAPGAYLSADQSTDALAEITDVCRSHARRSDILGYLGDSRVAILAPDTDVTGVQRLIDRLQQAMGEGAAKARPGQRAPSLRAGYCAVSNLATANIVPSELVRRAETALASAPRGGLDSVAVNFDEVLPS
jgi:Response regulator containing a CheY-like receiver domain and a GGDEF domain